MIKWVYSFLIAVALLILVTIGIAIADAVSKEVVIIVLTPIYLIGVTLYIKWAFFK